MFLVIFQVGRDAERPTSFLYSDADQIFQEQKAEEK